jgi:hypothetical protein
VFTGVKGKLKLLVSVKSKQSDNSEDWDNLYNKNISNNKKGKFEAVEFDLIPGFTINFDEQPVFDKELVKKIMQ